MESQNNIGTGVFSSPGAFFGFPWKLNTVQYQNPLTEHLLIGFEKILSFKFISIFVSTGLLEKIGIPKDKWVAIGKNAVAVSVISRGFQYE